MSTYVRLSRQFTHITKSQHNQFRRHLSKTTYKMAANLNSENISKITDAEKKLTGMNFTNKAIVVPSSPRAPLSRGVTDLHLTKSHWPGILNRSDCFPGSQNPVRGGPTAQAQSNAGQPINSQTLHDITEGEKKVTGSERPVKGGPTSVAQSILSGVSFSSLIYLFIVTKMATGRRCNIWQYRDPDWQP